MYIIKHDRAEWYRWVIGEESGSSAHLLPITTRARVPIYRFSSSQVCCNRRWCTGMIIGLLPARLNASIASLSLSVRMVVPIAMKKPNVAAEPAIYCPSVRIIPFGPGPYLMMFVAPKMKPMMRPTPVMLSSEGGDWKGNTWSPYCHPSWHPS